MSNITMHMCTFFSTHMSKKEISQSLTGGPGLCRWALGGLLELRLWTWGAGPSSEWHRWCGTWLSPITWNIHILLASKLWSPLAISKGAVEGKGNRVNNRKKGAHLRTHWYFLRENKQWQFISVIHRSVFCFFSPLLIALQNWANINIEVAPLQR